MTQSQKELHPTIAARRLNKPPIYNLDLFMHSLVTKQPQFQEPPLFFKNPIKWYTCTHWKTLISIPKCHTGSTQLLFLFFLFHMKTVPGATLARVALNHKQTRLRPEEHGAVRKADRHQHRNSENSMFWENSELE